MTQVIELISIVLTLLCLAWGAYEDIKNRLAPDKIWLIQIIGGIILIFWWNTEYPNNFIAKVLIVTNILFSILFAMVSFYSGAFGGGDAKAIIALSFSAPFNYLFLNSSVNRTEILPPVLSILLNFLILFILLALIFLANNLASNKQFGSLFNETNGTFFSKFSVLLSCRRVDAAKIHQLQHEDPIEIYTDGAWKLNVSIYNPPMDDESYEKMEKKLKEDTISWIEQSSRSYIWVRPQPPGLVFILVA
ncbi:MAG: prepilin peptidase, partial [Candidatus Heimdallarchaeota archaeon]|nr:prepilin peptidase [Candidatus Heimdallarchaeota archaeon]